MGLQRSNRKQRRRIVAVGLAVGGFCGFLATVQPALDLVQSAGEAVREVFRADPSAEDAAVGDYVEETKRLVRWEGEPTIYLRSVELFKKRFADFDPTRVHSFSLRRKVVVDVPSLVERAPEFDGRAVAVRGQFRAAMQIAAMGPVSIWVLEIGDPTIRRAGVLCRVPLPTTEPPSFERGDTVYASALVVADGPAVASTGAGYHRVLYLACSAVGSVTRFTFTARRDRNGRVVGVLSGER